VLGNAVYSEFAGGVAARTWCWATPCTASSLVASPHERERVELP
jgi:hypothetical protein